MSSVVRNFIVTFCVSLLIFAIIAYSIFANVANMLPGASETDDSPSVTTAQPISDNGETASPSTPENTPASSTGIDDSFTMLLVGTDYQPDILDDYDQSALNKSKTGFPVKARTVETDAILLLKADREKGLFMFAPLPADLTVSVEGVSTPLGYVYAKKGVSYLCETVRAMTGISIDYYAVASVTELASVIDSIGGITYTVPTDMYYNDPSQQLEIAISKGNRTLNGVSAVNMLRFNSYANGDVSRRALAVSFAKALFKKLATPDNLATAATLYTNLSQYVTTNFTLTDLTRHLEIIFAFPDFTSVDLTYPGSSKTDSDGNEYFDPDLDAAIELYMDYR